jgi:hypothetical protein
MTKKDIDTLWNKATAIVDEENQRLAWAERYLHGKVVDINYVSHSFHNANFHIEITAPEWVSIGSAQYEILHALKSKLTAVGLKRFGKIERCFREDVLGDRYHRGMMKFKPTNN